jgi:hypothetical protein
MVRPLIGRTSLPHAGLLRTASAWALESRPHANARLEGRICLPRALRRYPGTTIARVGLPFCVTPSLAYYRFGSRARHTARPKANGVGQAVSITELSTLSPDLLVA